MFISFFSFPRTHGNWNNPRWQTTPLQPLVDFTTFGLYNLWTLQPLLTSTSKKKNCPKRDSNPCKSTDPLSTLKAHIRLEIQGCANFNSCKCLQIDGYRPVLRLIFMQYFFWVFLSDIKHTCVFLIKTASQSIPLNHLCCLTSSMPSWEREKEKGGRRGDA